MGVRESATLRSGIALPCGALFTDLWPDRSAPDCGMDSGRQTQCAVSASDAQIYLEPNRAWRLNFKYFGSGPLFLELGSYRMTPKQRQSREVGSNALYVVLLGLLECLESRLN